MSGETLNHARALGITAPEEAVYAFVDYVQLQERARHVEMNHKTWHVDKARLDKKIGKCDRDNANVMSMIRALVKGYDREHGKGAFTKLMRKTTPAEGTPAQPKGDSK